MNCTQCGQEVIREDDKWLICPGCRRRFLIAHYLGDQLDTKLRDIYSDDRYIGDEE